MDATGIFKSMHAAAIFLSWMKDICDDGNQEYDYAFASAPL